MIIDLNEDQYVAIGETAEAAPYCSATILIPRSKLDPILDAINLRADPAILISDLQSADFEPLLARLASERARETP